MTKAEEDWFLRGGKRPEREPDTVTVKVAVCQNCGGYNLPDDTECTHCGAPLTGEPSTEEYCGCDYSSCPECGAKLENPDDIDACVCPACGWEPSIVHDGPTKFFVTVLRTKTIDQKAVVCVEADDEDDACEKVEAMIDDGDPDVDDWPWRDLPGDPNYTDVLVDEAEPAE